MFLKFSSKSGRRGIKDEKSDDDGDDDDNDDDDNNDDEALW